MPKGFFALCSSLLNDERDEFYIITAHSK